jgi:pimeloyl-ACP methyl ester carboxylesterase
VKALTNLRAFAVPRPRRHLGFQMAWERLRPDMVEWIERTLPKEGQLILTGHSLGGAIAFLAAFELAENYHVRAVVTIGAPRVGLEEFRDQYLRKPNRPVIAGESAAVLGQVTRRITHADDFVSRVPPGPIYRHVGEEWRLDAQGMLVPGASRGALDRLFAGLDTAGGWCYRQLDAQRMTPPGRPKGAYRSAQNERSPVTSSPVAVSSYGATVLGRPPLHVPVAGATETPTPPLGRLGKDVLRMQQRFPFLSMVTLTGLQWTLIGVGAVVSCGVFVISVVDLNAHRSQLYVDAFALRYAVAPIALNNPAISEFVRRALESKREE